MVVTGLHKAMKWHLEIQERLILASISRSVSPSLHSDPQADPDQAGLRLPAPAAAEIRPSSGHPAGPDLIRPPWRSPDRAGAVPRTVHAGALCHLASPDGRGSEGGERLEAGPGQARIDRIKDRQPLARQAGADLAQAIRAVQKADVGSGQANRCL